MGRVADVRVVFAGTPAPAVPSLQRLIASERHEVIAVLTRPDAVAGRGRKVSRSPVGLVADEAGIPVLTPRKMSEPDFVEQLTALAPDCCPVVAYGALIPKSQLALPKYGWINLHFSLLPAWRGAAPVQAAINAGDEFTGATTFIIEEGLDTGPVLGVMTERIGADDTAGALLDRLAVSGAALLESTLDAVEAGVMQPVPQPVADVSYAPKISVEGARIRWDQPALAVHRHIRSVTPAPGAWTTIGGVRVKVGPVSIADESLPIREVLVRKDGVYIGTATSAVRLDHVQPQGKKMMNALDWSRGARLDATTVVE